MEFIAWNNLVLCLASFVTVAVLTPIARKIAIKTKFFDFPNEPHKTHLNPVPYLGGVSISAGILVVSTVFFITYLKDAQVLISLAILFLPAISLSLVGLIDDRIGLPRIFRLISQLIVGISTSILLYFNNMNGRPSGDVKFDIVIAALWVVAICNSINFFDNIDGGASGAISAAVFGISFLALSSEQIIVGALSTIVFGAILGFFIWNKYPAKIYMGDSGSMFLGTLIAILTLRLEFDVPNKAVSFLIPILLLAIPLLDTSLVLITRISRKISPFQAGTDHLSHAFLKMGFQKRTTSRILWFLCYTFSLLAIIVSLSKIYLEFFVILSIVLWLFLLLLFTAFNKNKIKINLPIEIQ